MVTGSTKSGDVIARVRATDADAGPNAILTYSMEEDPDGMFSITPETGVIRLESNWIGSEESDFSQVEKETVYHLVVVASDDGAYNFRLLLRLLLALLLTDLLGSAVAEKPRDARCQWKSCQLLHSCTKNSIQKGLQ